MDILEANSKIKLLPEHIIDQIKAGEVIERPASLLKELLENALDAGSTKLQIHLVNNGLELIEIIDNGQGMSFHDLPLAFCRHATSKLSRFEDLYRLNSYGFRGEALASLASIAKVRCTSMPLKGKGGKIVINGGVMETHVEHTEDHSGTSFYIKDLFYNTPARLKFIKSKTAEKNALEKVIYGFVLNYPHVEFQLKWDEKDKEIYSAQTGEKAYHARLKDMFFRKNVNEEKAILEWEKSYNRASLKLTMLADHAVKSGMKCQYILVNNRQIQDKQLHAIISHFADKLGHHLYSHYIISLTIHPEDLDVNVHPNKLFVKFHQAGEIFGLISGTLKSQEVHSTQVASEHKYQVEQEFPLEEKFSFKDLKTHTPTMEMEQEMVFETLHMGEPVKFLTAQFCLHEYNQTPYLIHLLPLIKSHLLENLKEEGAIPLMISEPIQLKEKELDQHFEVLGSLGFELDRLNSETLALRTMPEGFDYVNGRDLFKSFLKFYLPLYKESPDVAFKMFFETESLELHFDRDFALKVIAKYTIENLKELGVIRELNNFSLKKLFD